MTKVLMSKHCYDIKKGNAFCNYLQNAIPTFLPDWGSEILQLSTQVYILTRWNFQEMSKAKLWSHKIFIKFKFFSCLREK